MCSSPPVTPQSRKKLPRLGKMEERQGGTRGIQTAGTPGHKVLSVLFPGLSPMEAGEAKVLSQI